MLGKMMEWKQKPGQTNEDFKQQKRNYYAKLYDKLTGRMSKSGYQDYVAKVKKTYVTVGDLYWSHLLYDEVPDEELDEEQAEDDPPEVLTEEDEEALLTSIIEKQEDFEAFLDGPHF
mmetsp:Transcript_182/g.677  ORF Transcript_182/g.677 Transcript_182/m.677 type:complete len:117 (+) Transcript_182:126-476(+)